jgi:hypothetical protein
MAHKATIHHLLPAMRVAALGYGAVHAVNKADGKFKMSQRTAAGADKWLVSCLGRHYVWLLATSRSL